MKHRTVLVSAALLFLSSSSARAQFHDLDTWLDTDGDGLPDSGPQVVTIGVPVTFDIWWDGKDYVQWSNWLYYVTLGPGPDSSSNYFDNDTSEVDVVYWISNGFIYPEDNFTQPNLYGLGGGFFPDLSGVLKVASVTMTPIRTSLSGGACIVPKVDVDFYTGWCQLSTQLNYGLFDQGDVTPGCYAVAQPPQACCFSDGTCVDAQPEECVAVGGVPQGAGTSCASTPCVTNTTESRSWGRLKALYN